MVGDVQTVHAGKWRGGDQFPAPPQTAVVTWPDGLGGLSLLHCW